MDPCIRVAVVGGGITGSTVFSTLAKEHSSIHIHLFDQGRAPGGRASTRFASDQYQFDHGCQFFRADTDQVKAIVREWVTRGWAAEWKGVHRGSGDFFGLPDSPGPVYTSAEGGLNNITHKLIDDTVINNPERCKCFVATRVENLQRQNGKWCLMGKSGKAALHDTAEKESRAQDVFCLHEGEHDGYDYVILTDLSSSFEGWHRASAGVPAEFAARVREKAGARVSLFSCMVAFKEQLFDDDTSSVTFESPEAKASSSSPISPASSSVWFAACHNSKPGFATASKPSQTCVSTPTGPSSEQKQQHPAGHSQLGHCWTLISTPEYAMKKICETPMQDPVTGAFIPQHDDYLLTVPAPELVKEFLTLSGFKSVTGLLTTDLNGVPSTGGDRTHREGNEHADKVPEIVFWGAQRWGSALPGHRHVARDESSSTRHILAGVAYDSACHRLAPTTAELDELSYVADDRVGLIHAGDMVSAYTPGFESAVLSAVDAAEHALELISRR
eukprot:gene4205-14315_t